MEQRNQLADRYRQGLAGVAGIVAPPARRPGSVHAYHLFAIQVADRARVHAELHRLGIGVQVHFVPTYRFGAYADAGARSRHLRRGLPRHRGGLRRAALAAPVPRPDPDDQQTVIDALLTAVAA